MSTCLATHLVAHNGNITYKEVYDIAKVMRPRSMSRKMAGTVKVRRRNPGARRTTLTISHKRALSHTHHDTHTHHHTRHKRQSDRARTHSTHLRTGCPQAMCFIPFSVARPLLTVPTFPFAIFRRSSALLSLSAAPSTARYVACASVLVLDHALELCVSNISNFLFPCSHSTLTTSSTTLTAVISLSTTTRPPPPRRKVLCIRPPLLGAAACPRG